MPEKSYSFFQFWDKNMFSRNSQGRQPGRGDGLKKPASFWAKGGKTPSPLRFLKNNTNELSSKLEIHNDQVRVKWSSCWNQNKSFIQKTGWFLISISLKKYVILISFVYCGHFAAKKSCGFQMHLFRNRIHVFKKIVYLPKTSLKVMSKWV